MKKSNPADFIGNRIQATRSNDEAAQTHKKATRQLRTTINFSWGVVCKAICLDDGGGGGGWLGTAQLYLNMTVETCDTMESKSRSNTPAAGIATRGSSIRPRRRRIFSQDAHRPAVDPQDPSRRRYLIRTSSPIPAFLSEGSSWLTNLRTIFLRDMADAILEQDDCQKVLEALLKTTAFQISSFRVLPFHNPLQGLVGEHFTLRVEYIYQDEPHECDFFVKTLSTNPMMVEFSKTVQVYEKEVFFYNLLEEFEKEGIDTSFAPRGYFFKPGVVVLEDLSKAHYKGTPKRRLLDLEHCQRCLETVAKLHAAGLIYETKKSKALGRKYSLVDDNAQILEDKFASKEETIATRWMQSSIQGVFALIDLIPETHITHASFKSKLLELLADDSPTVGLISGLLHNDLWTSNFLHQYKDAIPVETKLVDFQLIKYGPLELDVAEFLMTNSSRELRAQHYAALTRHYFDSLGAALVRAGLDPEILPPKSEFVRSCDNFKLVGKVHAIVDHSFTFVADEIYGDAMKSEESFRKFVFEERGRCIIESYNTNEEFRNVLREDVLELRDLLFSN
ncbi:hypothetical protein MTP99_010147 [Tenebrio molitor]|nr:hypothetical protein MTP99_010147 [Tenebrio molitor]